MELEKVSSVGRKTIGVFVSNLGRMWWSEFLHGVEDAARRLDLNVICFVGGKPAAVISPGHLKPSYGLYDLAAAEQLAGLIVSGDLGYDLNPREVKLFLDNFSHLPLVVIGLQAEGIPNLIADNLQGMRAAVGHLFDAHGYKTVAFIRGPENQLEAEQRFLAYRQELKARKIRFDSNLVLPGDFSLESGRAAVSVLLDKRKLKVDAIVAANDRMAVGAFEALQLRGIQVPGGMALVGFDDLPEASTLGVPLTTVRQPYRDIGTRSVSMLLDRINGSKLPDNILVPTGLVVRWSCGCLPESVHKITASEAEAVRTGSLENKHDIVISGLLQVAKMSPGSPYAEAFRSAGEHAWETLLGALGDESKAEIFLHAVEDLLSSLTPHTEDIGVWHSVVSALRRNTFVDIDERGMLLRAGNLFQQARIFTEELHQRLLSLHRLKQNIQKENLQAFSASMAPAMSLEEIGSVIKRHFPGLGIDRMYMMLYSSVDAPLAVTGPPSEEFHLVIQFDETGVKIPTNRPKWGTGRLIPRGYTPQDRRYSAVLLPLILAQNSFGFLWMEMKEQDWEVFTHIRNLISSALLRSMLVEQRASMQHQVENLLHESHLRTRELAKANEEAGKTSAEIARLYSLEQQRRKNAETLSAVVHNLSTLLKMDQLPQQIIHQLANLLPHERGALLLEEMDGTTRVAAHRGFPSGLRSEDLLHQVDVAGAYLQILRDGQPVVVNDVVNLPNYSPVDWLPVDHSWMGVPLFSKNKVIGLLALARRDPAAFTEDDLLLVTMFGIQAAISLENARHYDGITRFNEMLERMVSQRVDELNEAYSRLEKLDKNKTSFIQVTAHELRTPITIMKGYLSMLRGSPGIRENPDLLQAVDGVIKGTDRLHSIVNSMLDVTRLEQQALTPRMETVVIGSILQKVQNEYQSDLNDRSIKLTIEDAISGLPLIQADSQLLQKAFDAVVVNAIKFTPDGGSIRLGGREIQDERLGQCLELNIRDTGIGIDPENHRIIFEKLFQLGKVDLHSSGRTKFKGGGPGLGLAIASSIIRAHHGRIWVESPGCDEERFPGSTFYILLPLSKNN